MSTDDHRSLMIEYLRESHRMIAQVLEGADYDDAFPFVFGCPETEDLQLAVHAELAHLLRKAQMHMTAVIHANRSDNLHSLAVHVRVILECAAWIGMRAHAANEGSPEAKRRILNAVEYDFRDSMLRLWGGNTSEAELQQTILDARAAIDEDNTDSPNWPWATAQLSPP